MAWEALSQRKNTQASMTQSWVSTLMITMLLGGLWHGAAWNYVAWGALHGVGLCANKLCARAPRIWDNTVPPQPRRLMQTTSLQPGVPRRGGRRFRFTRQALVHAAADAGILRGTESSHDSPLEGDGFEPSVPRGKGGLSFC